MEGSAEVTKIVAFLLTVAGAQLIAVFFFYLSRRSSQEDRNTASSAELPASFHPNPHFPEIIHALEPLSGSGTQRQKVASDLAELVQKKTSAQVDSMASALRRQYEQTIQEKGKEAAQLHQKYKDVLTRGKQTERILRSVAEGLVVVNQKGEVVLLNPAAEKLLGMSTKEKMGKPLAEGLQEEQILSLFSEDGQEQEIVFSSGQNQAKRVLRSSNAVIEDDNGKTVGVVSVLTDVTKQKELDQLKSDFVASVTHELRTPLLATQHSLEAVFGHASEGLSHDQQDLLKNAEKNLDRLSNLINNLLDLAKLEASKVELKTASICVREVIEDAYRTFSAWAQGKNIRLEQMIFPSTPNVMMDVNRITQVLHNLIGNAIKFTPRGGSVTIAAQPRDSGQVVEISVSDTGVGIEKDDIPKLFKKFQQVGEKTADAHGGTGLGLAISKEIVELHGGTIWVESEKGQGARFAFTLSVTPKEADHGKQKGG